MPINLIHKLRALLFSPNSKLELWARTLYHRTSQTKVYFKIQDWLARRSYKKWLQSQARETLPETNPSEQPKITLLLDGCYAQEEDLAATLESISNLEGRQPQVLLITRQPEKLNFITERFNQSLDLKVMIGDRANLLEDIEDGFVIFCQAGDQFFSSLLKRFYLLYKESPDADLIYYDCEIRNADRPNPAPIFKSPTASPALCLSYNMFSRGFIRTARLKEILDQISPQDDLFAKEYYVCLNLLESNANLQHLPNVLICQNTLPKPESSETYQVVLDHLSRSGVQNPSADQTSLGTRFCWTYNKPSLSIVIPTKNNISLLKPLIQSLLEFKDQYFLTINIVDNDSADPKTLAYYDVISPEPDIQILNYRKPFNYSEAINFGVHQSDSDLVLLMNDDMESLDQTWLPEMVQWAQREEVGVVGASLLRANHTIQHIGIIMGLVGFVGHIYLNAPEGYFGLWGSADWYRDLLAVTGACQMMRREVFEEVGGYDEGFQLAFGDIDFCLRVHQQGYRNIFTPFARLYHYEGRSRGYQTPVDDILRGYEKFGAYLTHPDPYFSPNLTDNRIPKCRLGRFSEASRKEQIRIRKRFYTLN